MPLNGIIATIMGISNSPNSVAAEANYILVTLVEIRPMLSAAKCSPANLVFGSMMIYDDILRNY